MAEEQGSSAWELSKENVVPMRSGRNKAALAEIGDPSDSTSKHALEQKRRELQQAIQGYTGDDPLENWVRLIKWTQEHLTGGKAELQKVLEACTTALLKHERYKNDIRFLRIWIQYADCLPDPNDVFLFLMEKQVGMEFALFFEAYATYYELRGNCSAADAVYQDGINRGARPLERLKQKYIAFKTRMAARIQRKIQDESVNGPAVDEPHRASLAPMVPVAGRLGAASSSLMPAPARPIAPAAAAAPLLGVTRAPAASSLLLPTHQQQQQQQQQGRGAPGLLSGGLQVQRPTGPAVPVAVDDEFQAGGPRAGVLPGYSTIPQGVNNLKELKPYGVVRKENNEKPGMWAGSTLAQAGPGQYAPSAPAKLEICVDDEFQEEEAVQTASAAAVQPSFRQLVDSKGGLTPGAAPPAVPFSALLGGPAPVVAAAALAPLGGSKLMGGLLSAPLATVGGMTAPSGALSSAFGAQPRAAHLPQPAGSLLVPQPAAATGLAASLAAGRPSMQPHTIQPLAPAVAPNAPTQQKRAAVGNMGYAPVGYDAGLLQGRSGEEQCFEEARAARWMARNPMPPTTTATAPTTQPASSKPPSTGVLAPRPALGTVSVPGPTTTAGTGGQLLQPHGTTARKAFASLGSSTAAAAPMAPGAAEPTAPTKPAQAARKVLSTLGSTASAPAPLVAPAPQPAKPEAPARRALGIIADAPPAPVPAAAEAAAPAPTAPAAAAPATHVHAAPTILVGMIPEDDDFFAGPELSLPGPSSHHMAEPTVTVSTRAAFAAMNDMFGDGAGASVTAASMSYPAAMGRPSSMSVGPTAFGAGSRVALQPPADAPVAKRMHHEPTVTINTRLAFDAMNDMFSDSQPGEQVARHSAQEVEDMAKMPTLPAAMKPISAIDVCRLANSSKAVGGGSGGLGNAASGSLPIHEDTEYIRPDLMESSRGMGGGSHRGRRSSVGLPGLFPAGASLLAPSAPAGSFGIHEDTHLLPAAAAIGHASMGAARAHSLNIYEDTVCVGMMPLGPASAAASKPPAGGLYEDTEFFAAPPPRTLASSNAPAPAGGMAAAGLAAKPGHAPRPAAGWQAGGKEN